MFHFPWLDIYLQTCLPVSEKGEEGGSKVGMDLLMYQR